MNKLLVLALSVFMATGAHAIIYKCMDVHGKYHFSDLPCKNTEKAEVVPDRSISVSEQEQKEAKLRAAKMQQVFAEKKKDRAADAARQEEKEQDTMEGRREAISSCVRDVEKHSASQNIKAEMLAACQSANAISIDAARECVSNVERTGASENEKIRQVAICHGANVEPRIYFR